MRRVLFDMMASYVLDRDMGARHRARASAIQIIKVEVVPANKCRRPNVKQFHVCSFFRRLFVLKYCISAYLLESKVPVVCFSAFNMLKNVLSSRRLHGVVTVC